MWEIFFFKNHAENGTGRLVSDLFLFFRKALCGAKAIGKTLILIYFGSTIEPNY